MPCRAHCLSQRRTIAPFESSGRYPVREDCHARVQQRLFPRRTSGSAAGTRRHQHGAAARLRYRCAHRACQAAYPRGLSGPRCRRVFSGGRHAGQRDGDRHAARTVRGRRCCRDRPRRLPRGGCHRVWRPQGTHHPRLRGQDARRGPRELYPGVLRKRELRAHGVSGCRVRESIDRVRHAVLQGRARGDSRGVPEARDSAVCGWRPPGLCAGGR